jgi:putative oxidoreductase
MNQARLDDSGKLIIRLTLGVVVLLHGIAKLTGGVAGIQGMLAGAGLPEALAWGAYLGEVLGPLLLIVGFYARIGAALIAINMLMAVALAHMGQVFLLTDQGGWAIELQALMLFTAVGLIFTGPGRYAINNR